MPTKQTAMRLSDKDRQWLERMGQSMAEQLREDIETLRQLTSWGRRRWQTLEENEQRFLCDALVSTRYEPTALASLPTIMAAVVEDACDDNLDETWSVDGKTLASWLREMTPAEAYCFWHEVRLWWAQNG